MANAEYPDKTCSIDSLVTHPRLVSSAVAGTKTQQRRAGVYGYPGECFQLEGIPFVVSSLRQQALDSMTEDDAKREGYSSMEAYRELILKMHRGMEWDGQMKVWVHEFKRQTN